MLCVFELQQADLVTTGTDLVITLCGCTKGKAIGFYVYMYICCHRRQHDNIARNYFASNKLCNMDPGNFQILAAFTEINSIKVQTKLGDNLVIQKSHTCNQQSFTITSSNKI